MTKLIESICPMIDVIGRHWEQPHPDDILIDDKWAVMTLSTFNKLAEYSATNPSGVYPGKMWKRHDGIYDLRCLPEHRRWLVVWYGHSDFANQCSVNYRTILIAD